MIRPDTDNILLGWRPADAANRSVQAVYGFILFSTVGHQKLFLEKLTADTIAWLKRVSTLKEDENIDIVEKNRKKFEEYCTIAKIPLLSGDACRLWRLFMKRYDFYSCKLRANINDVIDCFNIEELSNIFSQPTSYFRRLPPSSELVLGPWKNGLRADLVIPPRLLVLDTILMLLHAQNEHDLIERSVLFEEDIMEIQSSGRLDPYVRQALILTTSALDNVLNEYGYVVIATFAEGNKTRKETGKGESTSKKGRYGSPSGGSYTMV